MTKFTSMERQDALQLFMFLMFFVYLGVVDKLFVKEPAHTIAGVGGVFLFFGLFFLEEYILFFFASHYGCLAVRMRPSNRRVYLFHERVNSRKLSGEENFFESQVILGEPAKLPEFGQVKDLVRIFHEFPWAQRVKYGVGVVRYKGFRVNHSHMAELEIWDRLAGRYDTSLLEPHPAYNLRAGSGDFDLHFNPSLGITVLDPELELEDGGKISGAALKQRYEDILIENLTVKDELRETTRQARDWHQAAIRAGEQLEHVQNEMAGLMKSKPDFRNAVIEEFLIERDVHGGVDAAIKHMQPPRFGVKFDTKTLGYLGLAAGVLLLINYKWKDLLGGSKFLLSWLSILQNQIFVGLIIVVVSLILWHQRRRRY